MDSVIFEKVSKTYGEFTALDSISFDIEQGSIFGVVGTSGAGKSTLIRTVNGLEKPTSGTVRVLGNDIAKLGKSQLRTLRRDVSMVFQHYNLLSTKTVAENVAMPLVLAGEAKASISTRVRDVLELVGLSDRGDHRPGQLSGGQRQRVGIARALVTNPKVLLCDEPTSALDPITNNQILDLLSKINHDLGITVLIITHQMDVIARLADKVAVLEHGKLIESGSVEEVFTNPKQELTKRFVASISARDLPAHIDASSYSKLFRVTSEDTPAELLRQTQARFGFIPDLLHADSLQLRNATLNTLILGVGRENSPGVPQTSDKLSEWLISEMHAEELK